jgi:hypothetical protein
MARIASPWPSTITVAVPRLSGWVRGLMPLLLAAGCASWLTEDGVAARVQVPLDLNVNPVETVVKLGEPSRTPLPAVGASAVALIGSPLGPGPL